MPSFRHFRPFAIAIAAVLALIAAPAGAAEDTAASGTKKKTSTGTATKKSGTTSKKRKTVSTRSSSNRPSTVAKAKTPPQRIDITRLDPAPSLYRKSAADTPASRTLSFFGSFASSYRYDSRMMRAAEIATARAYARSRGTCWRYVKNALLDAGVVDTRPVTGYAKEAGWELTNSYGFRKISCTDPYKAPVGSVLVYGGKGAGHVEIRTKTGFVSDFWNARANTRPLIGVYIKP